MFIKIIEEFSRVIKNFYVWHLLKCRIMLYGYILIITGWLYYYSIWDSYLLKDTIYWSIFSGIGLVLMTPERVFLKLYWKYFLRNFILYFFVEFFHISSSAPFAVKIVWVLICISIYLHQVYKKNSTKSSICVYLSLLIIFIMINHDSMILLNIFNIESIKKLLLPSVYMILTFPYFYFLKLYVEYECLFSKYKVNFGYKKDEFIKAKQQVIKTANINLWTLMDIKDLPLDKSQNIAEQIKNYRKSKIKEMA